MTAKRILTALIAVLLVASLAACGKPNDTPLTESDYLPSYQPALDIGIVDRLSAAQVSDIMGTEMTVTGPYEDGTWVIYVSANGSKRVSVSMKNTTTELFDAEIANLKDGKAIPSLGQRAFWYPTSGEVICFHGGYSIAVSVTDSTVAKTQGLCEAIVGKIITNIG